ncbi:hypothetical protein AUP68_06096 [Ilyonectria robusta]
MDGIANRANTNTALPNDKPTAATDQAEADAAGHQHMQAAEFTSLPGSALSDARRRRERCEAVPHSPTRWTLSSARRTQAHANNATRDEAR